MGQKNTIVILEKPEDAWSTEKLARYHSQIDDALKGEKRFSLEADVCHDAVKRSKLSARSIIEERVADDDGEAKNYANIRGWHLSVLDTALMKAVA